MNECLYLDISTLIVNLSADSRYPTSFLQEC